MEEMGLKTLAERFADPTMKENYTTMFPMDNPKNTRFSINYFTSVGLGIVTEEMREHLKNAPRLIMEQRRAALEESSSSDSDSDDSSSSDSDSASESSSRRSRSRSPPRRRLSPPSRRQNSPLRRNYSRSRSPPYRAARRARSPSRTPSGSSARSRSPAPRVSRRPPSPQQRSYGSERRPRSPVEPFNRRRSHSRTPPQTDRPLAGRGGFGHHEGDRPIPRRRPSVSPRRSRVNDRDSRSRSRSPPRYSRYDRR